MLQNKAMDRYLRFLDRYSDRLPDRLPLGAVQAVVLRLADANKPELREREKAFEIAQSVLIAHPRKRTLYIITFYSFKGGVGRTMALVNTGAELARRGRKVLLVDFDLEAPGLSTYDLLRPEKPHPGIVEYVTEFRRTRHSPLVTDFIYPAKTGRQEGWPTLGHACGARRHGVSPDAQRPQLADPLSGGGRFPPL